MPRVTAHRLPLVALTILVQLALAAGVVSAADPSAAGTAGASSRSSYIVEFRGLTDPDSETRNAERSFGFTSRFIYRYAMRGFAADLTAGQAAAIARLPFVESVQPDGVVQALGDPIAGGETVPPGIRRLGGATVTEAHGPASVNVAVIDTGVDLTQPDLNAVSGKNCINTGSAAQDDNGHGTHVAGTIGARNNGSGVIGVAPGTLIYAVKVLNAQGSGSWSQVICGIDWVTQNAASLNIKVANMSLGGGSTSALQTPIVNSTNAGVTYVVAAGNDGGNLANSSPANYTQVLAVTAVGDTDGVGGALGPAPSCRTGEADDRWASFSNYATSNTHRNHTIAGPGVCVQSTRNGGGTTVYSGTSMATPHVAGAVALCLSSGGACAGQATATVIQTMRSMAASHATSVPGDFFNGDPAHPRVVNGITRYYGYMTWIGNDLTGGGGGGGEVTGDFSLSASPTERGVPAGKKRQYTITVSPSGGFSSAVTLSVSGLGSGMNASFSPSSATSTSTLAVTTSTSTPQQLYTLTIEGTAGSLTHSTQVTLQVKPPK